MFTIIVKDCAANLENSIIKNGILKSFDDNKMFLFSRFYVVLPC
jgi:hypothetical protein